MKTLIYITFVLLTAAGISFVYTNTMAQDAGVPPGMPTLDKPPKTAVSSVNIGNLHIGGIWYSQVAVTYSDGTTEILRIPLKLDNY